MHDPDEGIAPDGTIVTGVGRWRVPASYEAVLAAALAMISSMAPHAAVYLYGSVATGQAELARSDVDLLAVGLGRHEAATLTADLSARFRDFCRGVEVASARSEDFVGESDRAYGNRVFLRHYCVHLSGREHPVSVIGFPADIRAARAFNGDIAQHARRWQQSLAEDDACVSELGSRVARKSLLAVAGLVSVHDHTWTTDRAGAARRWSEISPDSATDLDTLLGWAEGQPPSDLPAVRRMLDTTVDAIVARFGSEIGLWAGCVEGPRQEGDGTAG